MRVSCLVAALCVIGGLALFFVFRSAAQRSPKDLFATEDGPTITIGDDAVLTDGEETDREADAESDGETGDEDGGEPTDEIADETAETAEDAADETAEPVGETTNGEEN